MCANMSLGSIFGSKSIERDEFTSFKLYIYGNFPFHFEISEKEYKFHRLLSMPLRWWDAFFITENFLGGGVSSVAWKLLKLVTVHLLEWKWH